MQDQASSIERRIQKLRQIAVEKRSKGSIFDIFQLNTEDTGVNEKELQEVCQKIRFLQCENILKRKVFFFYLSIIKGSLNFANLMFCSIIFYHMYCPLD